MATCKKCLYYEVCPLGLAIKGSTGICLKFKNKADFVEVKYGKWEIKIDDYDCEYMMCSCCKEEFYPVDEDTVDRTPNFCPNCGAKMDGGKSNG